MTTNNTEGAIPLEFWKSIEPEFEKLCIKHCFKSSPTVWSEVASIVFFKLTETKAPVEETYLNFRSCHSNRTCDEFVINMTDDNGRDYKTSFKGVFGRLVFNPEIVRKAAALRKVMEKLYNEHGDELPNNMAGEILDAIEEAKAWIEKEITAPEAETGEMQAKLELSGANYIIEKYQKEQQDLQAQLAAREKEIQDYRKALEEIAKTGNWLDDEKHVAQRVLNKYLSNK